MGLRKGTRKIVCPNPKCHTKVPVVLGSRDNGDVWEAKEIICPNCRRPIKFRANNHRGKVVVLNGKSNGFVQSDILRII